MTRQKQLWYSCVILLLTLVFLSYYCVRLVDLNFELQQKYEAGKVVIEILEKKLERAEKINKELESECKRIIY